MPSVLYDLLYYVYVLFFGIYISIRLSTGLLTSRKWKLLIISWAVLLLLQGAFITLKDIALVQKLYPIITHLPIILLLILYLRVKWDLALTAVLTSYALCQLARWPGLVVSVLPLPQPLVCALHLAGCQLLLYLLSKHLLSSVYEVLRRSTNVILHFGILPLVYYAYEYFMLYTHHRFASVQAFSELLPTGLVLFFMLSVAAYQRELQKREAAEYQLTVLEAELTNAGQLIDSLRTVQEKTAVYRHDLRHHLMMIDRLLATNQPAQATSYIRGVQNGLESISPVRLCENETVNLILGFYLTKAHELDIALTVNAAVPAALTLPDPELCTMLSNGLENAMNAVKTLPKEQRFIRLSCEIKQNTLLIQLINPYQGEILMENGHPVASGSERSYGCRSILAIVQRRNGLCTFDPSNQLFTLRIALPMILPSEKTP